MNPEIFKGKWKEIKGDVKRRWGRLNDDDLVEIDGIEEMLLGMLQKHYGYARDEAEREYDAFMKNRHNPAAETDKSDR